MRSVLQALIWDSVRYSGWAHLLLLASCLLPMAIYALIIPIGPASGLQTGDPVMMLLEVSLMPFVIFLLMMGGAVSFANMGQLNGKPLSNLSITAWRTIGGSLLLALQSILIIGLTNKVFDVGWPLAGAALFTVALWFVMQPFLCLGGKSFSGFFITSAPIVLMLGWLGTRYKPIGGGNRDWNEISLSETVQLLAVIGVFAWCSLRSVALARRGDGLPLPSWLGDVWQSIISWPAERDRNLKPFRSVSRALFWYEWRWKGWALAMAYAVMLAVVVPIEMVRAPSLESYIGVVFGLFAGMILPATILGVLSGFQLESMQISLTPGRNNWTQRNEVDELGSFQATRPVSNASIARSKLLVCLSSVILTAALGLLIASPALVTAANCGTLGSIVTQQKIFIMPIAALLMWISTSNIIALMSTGRTKLLGSGVIALLAAFIGVLSLLEWLASAQVKELVLRSLLVLFTLALVGLAVWAYVRSYRARYTAKTEVVIAMAIVLAFSIAACFQTTVDVSTLVGAGVLCVLPWATTPLAIGWNRHR